MNSVSEISATVLLLAASLDYLIGDPWGWIHPVQGMGWIISSFTSFVIQHWKSPLLRKIAGVILGLGLILGSGCISWLILAGATRIHPLLGITIEVILLASCFAGRSLRLAAEDVLEPLIAKDLVEARLRLSRYVGRDTEDLSEEEILRAVLETVAENTTDGVTAPLFYAIASSFLPIPFIVPLPFAYKAASTLDSMVGYRKEPYTDIGWFSAQLEDYLTWLPCRFTVLTLAILSKQPKQVLKLCWRDARQDPSPNSGWSECAFAAAVGVQLGGKNVYGGEVKYKPLLGNAVEEISPEKVSQALRLMRICILSWLTLAIVGLFVVGL